MKPFATPADLARRWRALTEEEYGRAEVLLGDATEYICDEMSAAGVTWEGASDRLSRTLTMVCCNVVRRAMGTPVELAGVSNWSQGANGYSESYTLSNPGGSLYLEKAEKRALGISGTCKVGMIHPFIGYGAEEAS